MAISQVSYRRFIHLPRSLIRLGLIGKRYKSEEHQVDYNTTLMLYYPPVVFVDNAPEYYWKLRKFFLSDKEQQRQLLGKFVSVPSFKGFPAVIRPLRHHCGMGFKVANTTKELMEVSRKHYGEVYIASLFNRVKEFRVIFVGGEPVVKILKKVDGEIVQDQPINFCGDRPVKFVTIHKKVNDKLRKTSFYKDAKKFLNEYPFDLVAFDVGWDGEKGYTVFEVNFCPQITVQENINLIHEKVQALRG